MAEEFRIPKFDITMERRKLLDDCVHEIRIEFTKTQLEDITSDEMRGALRDTAESVKQELWQTYRLYKKDTADIKNKRRDRRTTKHLRQYAT